MTMSDLSIYVETVPIRGYCSYLQLTGTGLNLISVHIVAESGSSKVDGLDLNSNLLTISLFPGQSLTG